MNEQEFLIENGIFKGYNGKSVKELWIPEGVTEIGEFALGYANLEGCQKIVFPSTLKKIGRCALNFYYKKTLKTLEFLGDVETIDESAFARVSSLQTLIFRGKVGNIGEQAFFNTSIQELSIPEGIESIGSEAFYGCDKLNEIHLPGLKKIGRQAFYRCKKLSIIDIPENVSISAGAFSECDMLKKDGFLIVGNILFDHPKQKNGVVIPEGIREIRFAPYSGGFNHTVFLPSTIRVIENSTASAYYHRKDTTYQKPENTLCTDEKLSGNTLMELLDLWEITAKEWAAMYLFQSGKTFENLFKKHMQAPFGVYVAEMIGHLKEKGKAKHYLKAAEFVVEHMQELDQELIRQLYDACVEAKDKKSKALLEPYLQTDAESVPTENDPYAFLRKSYNEHLLDKAIKAHGGKNSFFEDVKCKDGTKAPAFVVKCAIVPYVEQYTGRPKHIGGYTSAYMPVQLISDADAAAAFLDQESLREVIGNLLQVGSAWMLPYGRYASKDQISSLITSMNQWKSWYIYGASGRSDIITARGALMLSDTREAMMKVDKDGQLSAYAEIRNTSADIIRDTVLMDFGFDENGQKFYDLGNDKKLRVSLAKDLSLHLYDLAASKVVKSIPKKDTDPKLVAAASADISDMKKNLKKTVKARNALLFESFLSGSVKTASDFISSYTKNPLLHRIAELIVWNQGTKTFILTQNGIIDADGQPYTIDLESSIGVAHPMEMKKEDVAAWQKYFTVNELKQPFEQIWEPVIDLNDIKEDRYTGCMIPYLRFVGKAEHGIYIDDEDFHNEITIYFDHCDADVERIDWRRHDIDMNDRFEIQSFSAEHTRKANHIVAYLDKITIYGRIDQDDASFAEILPCFTCAQIMELLNYSIEKKAVSCTALLLDYKNNTFKDYDPMDIFTLDF